MPRCSSQWPRSTLPLWPLKPRAGYEPSRSLQFLNLGEGQRLKFTVTCHRAALNSWKCPWNSETWNSSWNMWWRSGELVSDIRHVGVNPPHIIMYLGLNIIIKEVNIHIICWFTPTAVACPMIVTAFSIRSYTPYRPTHYSLYNAECEYVMCRCVDTTTLSSVSPVHTNV